MKVELKKHLEVITEFQAPLYGFDIEKTYTKIQKDKVKELLIELIDNDLSYIERTVDDIKYKLRLESTIRSLNP